MAKRILKTKPVFKAGDVLVNAVGSVWTLTKVNTRCIEGMLKRIDRDVPYPYSFESKIPVDWSYLEWEHQDDEFTRWVKEVREEGSKK